MPIKLVIFDMDGVLIDAKETHYKALNEALNEIDKKYSISIDEHLTTYDGLPTLVKLNLLTEVKKLPNEYHKSISKSKQEKTKQAFDSLGADKELQEICHYLQNNNIKIAVASNSIRETVMLILNKLGIAKFMDIIISNEDVKNCKPSPEMHLKCMSLAGVFPNDTLILEDSPVGRQAAVNSGSNLLPIKNRKTLTKSLIIETLKKYTYAANVKWIDSDLNVLIPMAGQGSRFASAGYTFPKPLIEVHGKPMIQLIVENLNIEANYIFICLKEHYEKYSLQHLLNYLSKNCKIIVVDQLTEGAACTTLLAKEHINNNKPLLIANSDQYIEWNSSNVMYGFTSEYIDGGILTFENCHPKWSYAKTENGLVKEVAEKKVISNQATVGIYYWKYGQDYVKYAEQMIAKNNRVNNEFYICPVFNEAIKDGKKIYTKSIDKMWGIGTPEDLNYFLNRS